MGENICKIHVQTKDLYPKIYKKLNLNSIVRKSATQFKKWTQELNRQLLKDFNLANNYIK